MQKLLLRRRSAYASIFAITLTVLLIQSFSPSSQTSSFSLSLDLDGAVGGQAMHSLNVSPDQDVSIQIFGTDIQNASGLSVRIEYDATQVVYEGFDTGDVLPNVRVQKGDSTAVSRTTGQASFVQINLASLGGSATVNSGLVGTLRFLTTDAFLGTEIRLVRAELGRGEQSEAVPLSLSVALRVAAVPDFDGSGTVDFPDFLFLVSVFGSRLNDGKYETKYDLDGNGEIAFDDFLIFVSSFGKSVDDINQPYATKRVATSSDFLSVCDRTPQVRDAIVTALGATDCGSVTEQNLSNLTNRLAINGSSESSISALKVGDFSGLSELRRLRLINNSLTTLDNNAFVGMSKLKSLEVSGGNISDIHAGAFGGLDSLSALSLEDNNITSLRDNTFEPLTELRILRLNSNDITSVSSLPLDDLSGVLVLDLYLASNKIASLSSRDFADVSSNLIFLDLQGNKLSALPDSLFYNMVRLLKLDFRSNSVDPLNMRVSLEKIQNSDGTSDKFFAKVHTGAPFDLNVPVTVSGGTLDVDNNVVTISAGSMSSSVVTATRIDATADNDITVTLGDVQISMGDIQNTSDRRRGLAFEKVSNSITLSPEVVAVFVFEPSVTWGNEQVSFVSADAFGVEENSSNVGTVSARIYRRPSEFKDLGDITGLTSGKGYFENNESLRDNHEKYYRFVLTQPKVINIGLRQLDVDTDLILEDADGSVLHLGTSNDPSKRAIKVSLCEGTYYAHVKVKDLGENVFNFRYGIVPGSPDASEVSRLRGRSIGGAVSGYTVSGGSDGDKFSISESGLLMFNDVPNYENPLDVASTSPLNDAGNNEYVVVVTGSGESSSGTQSIVVTVSDKDNEAPGQVETPVVSEATMNSLKVTWAVPANTGPEIIDYDVQYKASDDEGFTDAEYDGTDLTTTLTDLKPGTSYEVQVRAESDEGTGAWSDSGSGMTIENQAPVFTSNATFEVKENNTTVGTVSANDEDSDDSITGYAIIGGSDQEQFEITDEGALRFKAAPNYEVPADVESADPANVANNNEYIVEVTATGGASERVLTAAQTIVVTVTDKDDEAPGQVETPVVSEATLNSLKVTWAVPANTGPEITDYDVQYKASDDDGFTDADYDGTDLTTTLTGLKPSTSYEVQVRAKSDEGTGVWSDSDSGTTDANAAPVFTSAATFEVKENNTTVGTVSANDEDSDDSITGYAITGGSDQAQFEITDEGALRFKAAPNYEVPADVESTDPANVASNNEYIVEVTATGGASERVLTAAQTITVTVSDKDNEAPGQPAAPTVAEATLNSLKVTWAVPANTGPEITDYDVQYKASGESEFTDAEYDGTDLTMTLTNLKPSTSYEVQVRAKSDEGTSAWSDSGSGMTIENQAPVFTSNATFEVKENNTTVGTVSANDEDSDDSITGYAITGGVDQEQFEITDEGALRFKAAPNYEVPADVESADPANAANNNEYIVEVTATGGASERVLTAKQTLTVTVSDKDDEAPGQVETPVVSEVTMNSLKVTWEVPANAGPEITDYDVQYKASDDDGFTDAEYDGTDLTLTLTNLKPGTSYEVQVRAKNDEGTGAWSELLSVKTEDVFSYTNRLVNENSVHVGLLGYDRNMRYSIVDGQDGHLFSISRAGMLKFKSAPDYERPSDADGDNVYVIDIQAQSGELSSHQQQILVEVTDVDIPLTPPNVEISHSVMPSVKVTGITESSYPITEATSFVPYTSNGNGYFYWIDSAGSNIQRYSIGSGGSDVVISGLQNPTSLALDPTSEKIYWADSAARKIQRANLDGSKVEDIATFNPHARAYEAKLVLDLDNGKVYWTSIEDVSLDDSGDLQAVLRRANFDGSSPEFLAITETTKLDFAFFDGRTYMSYGFDAINIATNGFIELTLEFRQVNDLSVSNGKIYWANNRRRVIRRANVDGSNAEDIVAVSGDIDEVVFDPTTNRLYWTIRNAGGINFLDVGGDMDVQYRVSNGGNFVESNKSSGMTEVISGLTTNETYDVQARLSNKESQSEWSETIQVLIIQPVFACNENSVPVGFLGYSYGGNMQYSIVDGQDGHLFSISEAGMLRFKAAPDYEMPLDADTNNAYIVKVTATSGENGRAMTVIQTITVIVTDIGPPAELDAPTVTEATKTSLTITWENTSVVLNTDNVSMFNPIDVALDIAGNKMYWTDSGSIRRADLDGTNVENVIRDAVQFPVGIALDIAGNKMYWVDLYTDKVQRADLNGENIEDLVTTGQGKLGGIALDIARNKMYWMDSGRIRRADLDGENIEDLITGLPDKFGGIALDIVGNKMYWAIGDRIRRADLDGTNVEDLVTTGLENLFGIALDIVRNKMYWADRGTDKIQRADLNGRNVEDLIATGLLDPFGIALDIARNKLYWTERGIRSKKIGRIDLDLNYDIQYRIIDTTGFISANYTGEDLTTTLTDLAGTCEVQVRATNAEGTGDWSPSIQVFFTHPPEFPFESVRWNVRSHSTTSPDLDTDVSAQDNGNAPLTYTLIGPDADDFIFDPSNGRVQPKSGVYFDRDVKGHYDFSVVATGVRGGSDMLNVAIHVLQISNKRPYYDTSLQPLPIVLRLYNGSFRTNTDLSTVFKDDNEDDSDSFRYSLSGKDHRMFQVDQETGQLSPNPTYHFYFSGSHSYGGAFYTFKLHVSDGHSGTAEVPVHVYVSRDKTTESFRRFVDWRAWNGGRQAEPDYSMVPDFSYAGYHYFEKPIPELTERFYPIFDVTTYGAIPNDAVSDQPAIKLAIEAAETAGGGTIFFPKGEYLVNMQTDKINGKFEQIKIQGSNIVFKGEGTETNLSFSGDFVEEEDVPANYEDIDKGGSIIRQVYPLPSKDGTDHGTPPLFLFRPSSNNNSKITTIVEDAIRETFWVTVADASQLIVGQRVTLRMKDEDYDGFIAGLDDDDDWSDGLNIIEHHQIAEIRGDSVRFKEPLHFYKIRPEHGWDVTTYPHIEEVGVEDLTIQGSWEKIFDHHGSPEHDGGYTPIGFENCVNSWVRRVNFINVNRAMKLRNSVAVSVYQVVVTGNKGHFFIKNEINYGLWVGLTRDSGGSIYFSPNRRGQYHGLNTMISSSGTVYWKNDVYGNQSIDLHGACPYANLYDANNGGIFQGCGGAEKDFPHHLLYLVSWNHTHQRSAYTTYKFWSDDFIAQPIFVGYHRGEYGGSWEMNYEHLKESDGTKVFPSSLFEAQLNLRLGKVPGWFYDLAGEWKNIKARDIWVPSIFIKQNFADAFEDLNDGETKKVRLTDDYFGHMYISHIEYNLRLVHHADSEILTGEIYDREYLKLTRHRSGRVEIIIDAYAYPNDLFQTIIQGDRCPVPVRQRVTLDFD